MSDRRSRVTPFVGASAAGLALVFAATPHAVAQAPQSTSAPADPAGTAAAPQPKLTSASSSVAPNFGYQKFRVGVQVAPDAVFAPGITATTAGSEVTIVETGPSVANGSLTTTCTTDASTEQTGSSATYCKFPQSVPPLQRAAARNDLFFDDFYYAAPGDTVKLMQTTVEPHLLIDPVSQTVDPADNGCQTFDCAQTRDPIIFNDPARVPIAVGECISVRVGASALIDVLANDTPNGRVTKLAVAVPPENGAAEVVGQKIRYTPAAGHTRDSFTYEITTSDGTARAKVCVTILAAASSSSSSPPVSASASPTSVTRTPPVPSTSAPPLANTGASSSSLGAIGVGLLVVGGAATAAGTRRRSRGRHA